MDIYLHLLTKAARQFRFYQGQHEEKLAGLKGHVTYDAVQKKVSTNKAFAEELEAAVASYEDPFKVLIRQIFNGWYLREVSFHTGEYHRTVTECFIEAAGGDVIKGNLLELFSTQWSSDIMGLAAHYGFQWKVDPDGTIHILEDVPPAPGPEHYWDKDKQEWIAPTPDETAKEEAE